MRTYLSSTHRNISTGTPATLSWRGHQGGPTNGFLPAVDVFRRVNGQWQFSTTIQLPDDFDFSPAAVAFRDATPVVGNNGANSGGGAAWVFGLGNGSWVFQAKLSPSDLTAGSQFGVTIAVEGSSVIVEAPSAAGASAFSGAVYVFDIVPERVSH